MLVKTNEDLKNNLMLASVSTIPQNRPSGITNLHSNEQQLGQITQSMEVAAGDNKLAEVTMSLQDNV